jgi:hypothetical protein
MNKVNQDELYQNLNDFLKSKGIELKAGSYADRIRKGCNLLTEVVNLTDEALKKAKARVDEKLDEMRQTIHEKTAPKPPKMPAAPAPPPGPAKAAAAGPAKRAKRKTRKPAAKRRGK